MAIEFSNVKIIESFVSALSKMPNFWSVLCLNHLSATQIRLAHIEDLRQLGYTFLRLSILAAEHRLKLKAFKIEGSSDFYQTDKIISPNRLSSLKN